MLGWLVDEQGIEPHIPVIDKSERPDGTFSNAEFVFDTKADEYICPGGKRLKKYWRNMSRPRTGITKDGFRRYYARKQDCAACTLKVRCTPNQPTRKISRHLLEHARNRGAADRHDRRLCRELQAAEEGRDALRPPQAHPAARPPALRGPNGAKDEFLLAATAQNLRKLAKMIPPQAPPA